MSPLSVPKFSPGRRTVRYLWPKKPSFPSLANGVSPKSKNGVDDTNGRAINLKPEAAAAAAAAGTASAQQTTC